MKRAAFASWAVAVVAFYFRRAWLPLDEGLAAAWTSSDTKRTWLSIALLALAACGAFGVTAEPGRRRWWLIPTALGAVFAFALGASTASGTVAFLPQAVARAAGAALGSSVVLAAAWGFGGILLTVVARAALLDVVERFVLQLTLGLAAVAALGGGLAFAGYYRPPAVAAVLLAGIGVFVLSLARQDGRSRSPRRWSRPAGMDRAWFAVTVMALAVTGIGALAPEVEYDALWYHLWLPRQWLLHGKPFDTVHEFVTLYPMTWELVFGAGLVGGGPTAAKLLHFSCLPLLAVAAWQTTRRFVPAASPWLSAAITVTVPTVLWEATTAYIDLALALYVALGLYALFTWREGGTPAWFRLAALCFGIAAGIKHLALVALALSALALAIDPRPDEAGAATGPLSRGARRLVAPAALVVLAIVLAWPWYLRAWLASGNPFFPELFDLFGASPPLRWDEVSEHGLDGFKARFGVERAPLQLLLLPWTVTMHGARFAGSLGPVFLLLLPLVARASLRERPVRWLAGIVAGYVVVWASPLSSFQLRFLVPLVLPLAVLASRAVAGVTAHPTARPGSRPTGTARVSSPAFLGLAALLVLNLPPFVPLHEGDRRGDDGWLTHVLRDLPVAVVAGRRSADEYLRERVPAYGAWQYLRDAAPADARVLVAGDRHNFYATREPLSVDAVAARPAWSDDPARVARAIASLGVTHVLVERGWLRSLREPLPALAGEDFRRTQWTLEYADRQVFLYRIGQAPLTRRAP